MSRDLVLYINDKGHATCSFINKEKLLFQCYHNIAVDNNAIIITMVMLYNFASFFRSLLFCTFVDINTDLFYLWYED